MTLRKSLLLLIFFVLLISSPAAVAVHADESGWEQIVPGIEYKKFDLPDPNNVYVTRLDRANPSVIIDSSIANGKLADGKETVSGMFARYDQALNFWGGNSKPATWGMRNQVIVAINGSYFDLTTGMAQGGLVQSGWYAKRYDNLGGWGGFAWNMDRSAFISECLYHIPAKQYVTYANTGVVQKIGDINHTPKPNELVIYTPQYDSRTGTDSGTEVLVELSAPAMIYPGPRYISGIVRSIDNDTGNNLIPFNSIVLSGQGSDGTTLLTNAQVGSEIRISQEITSYDEDCEKTYPLYWTKTYSSLQGAFFFLKDGQYHEFNDLGAVRRNPRTAIAINDQYVFFIVVDGRSYSSVGMTLYELYSFTRDALNATWGVAQDGGGSSTMVINGQVVNNPSDGHEREVANGMLMIAVQPAEFSSAYTWGDQVSTNTDTELRLGPGTNYDSFTTLPAGSSGMIMAQRNGLGGVLAKSSYWWYVSFGDGTGWVPEEALVGTNVSSGEWMMHRFWTHGIRGFFR